MDHSIGGYLARMTPANVWPAAHSPSEACQALLAVSDPAAEILTWRSNGQCPMNDMLAAWVTLRLITMEQAAATSVQRQIETGKFLGAYRAHPPQPDAEQLHEMRNAFGPGATVVNVITGQEWKV